MYFEVRNQGTAGMLAVSSVVINRVNDDRFPNTICKVVNQGGSKKLNKCQFSWHCDGVSDIPKNKKIYKKNLDFARKIMDNSKQWIDITDGATFYHANYVRPSWRKKFIRTTEIDKHIFYRWNKK
jgi:spore germination cell wall hydrolase CwlJ-like protein